MAKVRTATELADSKFNYFIVLNIGVDTKNPNDIDAAIRKAFPTNMGASKDIYKTRLAELKDDIIEVVKNDAKFDPATNTYKPKSGARKEEADRATKFKLDETMQIVRAKCQADGIIYKSDLRKICTNANPKGVVFFKFEDLLKRFKDEKLDDVEFIDNETNVINFIGFDDNSDALARRGFANYYEYLGIPPTSTCQQVLAAESTVTRKNDESTADRAIKNEISVFSGDIKAIFKSDASRKPYDYYLKTKDEVWQQFKLRKGVSREMTLNEVAVFVGKLTKILKISMNEAKELIGAGLKNYGINVSGGSADSKSKLGLKDLSLCPFCGAMYVAGAKSCPSCGKLFVSACWNCGAALDLTRGNTCGKCGATSALQKEFETEVISLKSLYTAGKYSEYALKSETFKKKYSPLNQKGSLVEREIGAISQTSAAIVKKQQEKDTVSKKYLNDINAAITARQYFKAQNLLRQLKAAVPDCNAASEETRINAVITEVQGIYRRICTYGNDESRIIPEYMRLYDKCVDYSEAQSVIKKFPPQPPASVTISIEPNGNVVKWSVRPDDSITYSVIRKVGAAPSSINDGEELVSGLKAFTFTDTKAANVVPYFYGVYATRLGSNSLPASNAVAATRYENVKIKGSKVLSNGLKVEFTRVTGANRIIVVRSDDATPPKTIAGGTKIPVDEGGFVDTTLPGSGLYGYFIVCEYNVNGRTIYSSGVKETFEFFERPSFVENVRFKREEGNTFSVAFDQLKVGKFDIYASKTAVMGFKQHEYYNINKLNGLVDIDCKNVKPTSVNFDLPGRGDWYFYPVCIEKTEFTVGSEFVFRDTSPKSATVQYEAILKGDNLMLNFSCDHLVELDQVRVVGTAGRRPRNVSDGESVAVIDELKFKKGLFSKEYKASAKVSVAGMGRGYVYAVFSENDQGIIFKRKG